MQSPDVPPIPTRPVAVDITTFRLVEGRLHILLVKRKYPPYQGQWVLPGGFVGPDETVSAAATREMVEETGFDIRHLHLEQMKVYSEPGSKAGCVRPPSMLTMVIAAQFSERLSACTSRLVTLS